MKLTTEQMVQQLNKKFTSTCIKSGFKETLEKSKEIEVDYNDLTRCIYTTKHGIEIGIINGFGVRNSKIDFTHKNGCGVGFQEKNLEECVNKAYDYFIVKGGEL
jgi:hypothetical protein